MTPLDQEQVVQTVQVMLTCLSNPAISTPNDMLEGIVSGKSLLRGIISRQLIVCQTETPLEMVEDSLAPKGEGNDLQVEEERHLEGCLDDSPLPDPLELTSYG